MCLCSEFAFMAAVFFLWGFYAPSRYLSLVASRVSHSTQPTDRVLPTSLCLLFFYLLELKRFLRGGTQ